MRLALCIKKNWINIYQRNGAKWFILAIIMIPNCLKNFIMIEQKEKEIRRDFAKFGTNPKILIVTEKLLTGYDAPILYCMYLDKPLRDHALLQTIARVNRPYENEEMKMVKPHGFVLDFVGIFDKLEKALSFDSDEVNAIVKDLSLLKDRFVEKLTKEAKPYFDLLVGPFDDRLAGVLIEYFRDEEKRKAFFKLYNEIEMLYEIISPDAFLRPYVDKYITFPALIRWYEMLLQGRFDMMRNF